MRLQNARVREFQGDHALHIEQTDARRHPGARHVSNLEAPVQFNALLRDFCLPVSTGEDTRSFGPAPALPRPAALAPRPSEGGAALAAVPLHR